MSFLPGGNTWVRWSRLSRLRRAGVLSLNQRNAEYVLQEDRRVFLPRVDDKLLTKKICEERGVTVPRTYAVLERQGDVRRFLDLIGPHESFVVKPAAGSEGRGIVVIVRRKGQTFQNSDGDEITLAQLSYHLSTILSGLYSLGGRTDRAIVEERIVPHPCFDHLAVSGTPDIRVILYRGVPVMAMIRLPTMASRGRANLHQGAVGAGVDLSTGRILHGVWRDRAITAHPETRVPLAGAHIPRWNELLGMSLRLSDGLGLRYIGIDFVLDVRLGPVVLEANARPGLAIQIANRRGLLSRLEFVDSQLPESRQGTKSRLRLARELAAR